MNNKRNLFTNRTIYISLILISIMFSSCSWFHSPEKENLKECFVELSGGITFGSIYTQASQRSVFPDNLTSSLNPTDFDYSISAVCTSAEKAAVNATIKIDDTVTPAAISYNLGLSGGKWDITAKAERFNGGVVTALYTSVLKDFEITSSNVSTVQNFILLPPTENTGSVNLLFKVEQTSGVRYLKADWKYKETNKSQILTFDFSDGSGTGSAYFTMLDSSLSETSTPSGNYDVTFSFYDNQACTGRCLYQILNERITVFDDFTSDKWVPSSTVLPEYLSGSGKNTFLITKAIVDSFKITTFYVDYINGNDTTGAESDGDFFTPFKTIEKAVAHIIASTTDNTILYTIKLINDYEYSGSSEIPSKNNYTFVYLPEITASQTRKIKITSASAQPAKINANKKGRVMYISSNNNIILENIIISGGYRYSGSYTSDSSYYGGGIYNKGILTLLSSCVIGDAATTEPATGSIYSNCAYTGGGIYQESGVLNLYGPIIANNYSSGAYQSSSYKYAGGALSISGGIVNTVDSENLIQPDTIIKYNYSNYGGGISICYYENSEIEELVLSKLQVINNESKSYGGGIYIYESSKPVSFTNIKISDNTVSNSCGGGIYVWKSTLSMSDTEISNNTAPYGGGIYIRKSTLSLSGTVIGNDAATECADSENYSNKATSSGGGIYCTDSVLKLFGATISYNYSGGTSSDSQGGGGIYSENSSLVFIDDNAASTPVNYVKYNSAVSDGGGIRFYKSSSSVYTDQIFDNCCIYGNNGKQGGGLYLRPYYKSFDVHLGDGNSENGELIIGGDGNPLNANSSTFHGPAVYMSNYYAPVNLYLESDATIGKKDLVVTENCYANLDKTESSVYGMIYIAYDYSDYHLNFYIKGGTISGNLSYSSSSSSYSYGGGIVKTSSNNSYLLGSDEGATIDISGNKILKNGILQDSNVYIKSGYTLEGYKKINNDSKIGIKTEYTPSSSGIIFTKALKKNSPDVSPSSIFIPDLGNEYLIGWEDEISNAKIVKKSSTGVIKPYQNVKFAIDKSSIRLNSGNVEDRKVTISAKAGIEDIECTNWKITVRNRGVSAAETSSPAVITTENGISNTITIPENWFTDLYEIVVSATYSNITFTGNFELSCTNQIIPPDNIIKYPDSAPTVDMQLYPFMGFPLDYAGKKIILKTKTSKSYTTYKWYSSKNGVDWSLFESSSYERVEISVEEGITYYCCGLYNTSNTVYTDVETISCSDNYNALGNIYYSDKTYSSEKDPGKTPIGIVITLNEDGTPDRIISLEQKSNVYYMLASSYLVNRYSSLPFDYIDGANEWDVILKYDPSAKYDNSAYPAHSYCNSLTTGGLSWYLPSIGEFLLIRNSSSLIRQSLSKLGLSASLIDGEFWGSEGNYIETNENRINIYSSYPVYYSKHNIIAVSKVQN